MSKNKLSYLVLTATLGLTGVGYYITKPEEPSAEQRLVEDSVVELTDENFSDKFDFEQDWVLRFYQTSCSFCNQVKTPFKEVAKKYSPDIKFGLVNIVKNSKVPDLFQANVHPSVIFLKKGGTELYRLTGTWSEEDLEEILKKYYVNKKNP